nr:hypothetical protein [Acidithiobacillus montserratensis]
MKEPAVLYDPKEAEGCDMDDGTYADEDEAEGYEYVPDGGNEEIVEIVGDENPDAGDHPAFAAEDGLKFLVPRVLLDRLFRAARQPLEGSPTPAQFVQALTTVLMGGEG